MIEKLGRVIQGNKIFLATCRATMFHFKLKGVVANITTCVATWKLKQHVALSRHEFHFMQHVNHRRRCRRHHHRHYHRHHLVAPLDA